MTRGVCPFALNKLITPGSNDPAIKPRVAVLHVDAGNAFSLFSFFKFRSGGIESHFHIRQDGVIEQYRNIFWEADANRDANKFGVSIETQGFGAGKWNAKQLDAIKRLLIWINAETDGDVPLQECTGPYGSGVGYHIQFGSPGPWTPVNKACPGPERIQQYHDLIVPWLNSNPTASREVEEKEEDDGMKLLDRIVYWTPTNKDRGTFSVATTLAQARGFADHAWRQSLAARKDIKRLEGQVASLTRAVEALTKEVRK